MLLHGLRDDDVPFSEAAAMFAALDQAGVPAPTPAATSPRSVPAVCSSPK